MKQRMSVPTLLKQLICICLPLLLTTCSSAQAPPKMNHDNNPYYSRTDTSTIKVSNDEWKQILSPQLYYIAREKGTEYAFSGAYNDFYQKGKYFCAVCGNYLFDSDNKFTSHCGWPSFFKSTEGKSTKYEIDTSHNMERIEVLCARCDSQLGHVFNDGPEPTGKRYCMNSISLEFEPYENSSKQ